MARLRDLKKQLETLGARRDGKDAAGDPDRPDRLLQYFTKVAKKALEAERCSIFVIDPDTRTVWLKAGTKQQEHDIEVSTKDSIVGRVITSGQSIRESDLERKEGAHRETDEMTGFVTHNVLCVPIRDSKDRSTVGAIQVLNKKNGEEFSAEDEEALDELAEHIQVHVEQVYFDQDLYTLSQKIVNAAQKAVNFLVVVAVIAIVVAIFASIF